MSYGYIKDNIKEEDYIFGGGFVPQKVVLNESGDWSKFLPVMEKQAGKYETWSCTAFGTLNALEAIFYKVTGKESNFSDRFIAILAKIREPGSSPHHVAEIIRDNGLILQEKLPMPDTYEEFIEPDPLPNNLLVEGQLFLNDFDIKHEWVYHDNDSLEKRKAKIRESLKYSPLGVSVHAWKKEGKIYVKGDFDEDNHWTMLFKIDEYGFYHIFDTYENNIKVLSPDYNFERCKVYFILKRTTPRKASDGVLRGLIKTLIGLYQHLLKIVIEEEKKEEIINNPIEIKEVKEQIKTMNEKFYELGLSYLGRDASPKDFAKDNLACAESISSLLNEFLGGFPIITGTYTLREKLRADKRFKQVTEPELGCIIMSATGTSSLRNPPIKNGHVGIIGKDGKILSNNPKNGQFLDTMTLDYWKSYLGRQGKYPIEYYSLNV